MNAYIYCADIYCERCAKEIKNELRRKGLRPPNYRDEATYDSDEYPKGPFEDGGGEADSPQHCGMHGNCFNAITWLNGQKSGCFLENPLTQQGCKWVKEVHEGNPSEVTRMWADFYQEEISNIEDEDSHAICNECGEELSTCCDGVDRCLECNDCPGCSDGGPRIIFEGDDDADDD